MIKNQCLLVFTVVHILYGQCFYDSIHDTIKTEMEKNIMNAPVNSILRIANVIYPDCEEVKNKIISRNSENIQYENPWYTQCLRPYRNPHEHFLIDMKNGDDWIIGWRIKNNKYFQYIDGRKLTVLIKFNERDKINIQSDSLYSEIYKKTKDIIIYHVIHLDEKSDVKINITDSNYIEGTFIGTYQKVLPYKSDYFWTNGKYIVFEITKISYPHKNIKIGDLYWTDYCIDGIPNEDKRSFRRFRDSANIDLRQEMYKVFPWVLDSINAQRSGINREIYGKTPRFENKK